MRRRGRSPPGETRHPEGARYLDPERYGLQPWNMGLGILGHGKEGLPARLELDGDEFHLNGLTGEHVERVF